MNRIELSEQRQHIIYMTLVIVMLYFLVATLTIIFYPDKIYGIMAIFFVVLGFCSGWIIGLQNSIRIVDKEDTK